MLSISGGRCLWKEKVILTVFTVWWWIIIFSINIMILRVQHVGEDETWNRYTASSAPFSYKPTVTMWSYMHVQLTLSHCMSFLCMSSQPQCFVTFQNITPYDIFQRWRSRVQWLVHSPHHRCALVSVMWNTSCSSLCYAQKIVKEETPWRDGLTAF